MAMRLRISAEALTKIKAASPNRLTGCGISQASLDYLKPVPCQKLTCVALISKKIDHDLNYSTFPKHSCFKYSKRSCRFRKFLSESRDGSEQNHGGKAKNEGG